MTVKILSCTESNLRVGVMYVHAGVYFLCVCQSEWLYKSFESFVCVCVCVNVSESIGVCILTVQVSQLKYQVYCSHLKCYIVSLRAWERLNIALK